MSSSKVVSINGVEIDSAKPLTETQWNILPRTSKKEHIDLVYVQWRNQSPYQMISHDKVKPHKM